MGIFSLPSALSDKIVYDYHLANIYGQQKAAGTKNMGINK